MKDISNQELITMRDDLSREVHAIEKELLGRLDAGEVVVTQTGKYFRVIKQFKFVGEEISKTGGSHE